MLAGCYIGSCCCPTIDRRSMLPVPHSRARLLPASPRGHAFGCVRLIHSRLIKPLYSLPPTVGWLTCSRRVDMLEYCQQLATVSSLRVFVTNLYTSTSTEMRVNDRTSKTTLTATGFIPVYFNILSSSVMFQCYWCDGAFYVTFYTPSVPTVGSRVSVTSVSLCLSACARAYLWNHASEHHRIICARCRV